MCFFCISGELSKFQMSGCPTGNATLEFSTALPMGSEVTATFDGKNETVVPGCAGMSRCNFTVKNFLNSTLVIGIRIGGNTWKLATIPSPQCESHSTTVLHCLVFPINTSTTTVVRTSQVI